MDGIDQLQSSSRKLKDIYSNLDRYQTDIVTSAFGSGQDLSYNSLLKFAPLAENFQQYADNYKNELNKFQKLLNSVQQTGKRQAHEQRQAVQQQQPSPPQQQQPIVSKPVVTAQPPKQTQPVSKQTQSAVVTIPRDPINTIKPNGNSNNVTPVTPVTTTVPHPSKKPLISSNNNNNNNASSTNITRKSAQIRNPNTLNVNVNTNNNINQQSATTTYYQSQQTEYNRIAPQRQVVNTNASNMVNNKASKTSIPSSKPNINQQRQAPVSPNKTVSAAVSVSVSTSGSASGSVSVSSSNVNNNTNPNTNNQRSTVVRTASNISSAPKVVKTYSQPRNNPNNNISQQAVSNVVDTNNNNNNNNNGGIEDIYTKDLIASSQILDSYSSRRESYREQERMRKGRQKMQQQLSPEELKAVRRKKKREANKRRKAKKKAAEEQQRQQQSLSPQALDFDNNNYNEYNQNVSYGFNDTVDVGFDIEDSKDIRDQHAHFQVQNTEMRRAEQEFEQQNAFQCVTLKDIEKPKRQKNKYSYKYIPSETRFDEVCDGNDKYTTTMLRFQGFYNLEENNDEDKKKVQKQIIQEMKFKPEQVDWTKIKIKKDRSWCIVEVKAPGKFIKDMLKKQKRKNDRIFQINRQNRERERKRQLNLQFGNNSSQDESDADQEPIPKPKPIYRITEYERRNNTQDQIESSKLYILNFDILNKNCHKALTNLFLRFGDLRGHLEMGITQRDDPYAKVDYKNIEDARAVWEFQNRNGNPEQRIQFGSRVLTILYARH